MKACSLTHLHHSLFKVILLDLWVYCFSPAPFEANLIGCLSNHLKQSLQRHFQFSDLKVWTKLKQDIVCLLHFDLFKLTVEFQFYSFKSIFSPQLVFVFSLVLAHCDNLRDAQYRVIIPV